jgi:hypothetical protein
MKVHLGQIHPFHLDHQLFFTLVNPFSPHINNDDNNGSKNFDSK